MHADADGLGDAALGFPVVHTADVELVLRLRLSVQWFLQFEVRGLVVERVASGGQAEHLPVVEKLITERKN